MSVINTDPNVLMIRCECHGHVLEVASDDFNINEGIEPDFYFSVWNQSPTPFNLRNRVKLIWRLLCGKNLEGGDVMVTSKDVKEIVRFLNKKMWDNRINIEQQKNTKCQREH